MQRFCRIVALLLATYLIGLCDVPSCANARADGKTSNLEVSDRESNHHWAFTSPSRPQLPEVRHPNWCQSHIDRFILAEHDRREIQSAPPADRRTWIRRVYFDLTGLPPASAEVGRFVEDPLSNAKAKLLDRLLASPHYGERWGRHWLDVVRYADSNGLDENVAYGNAWRYRDYVIGAWNRDKPYDQFLTEQLAGDLLASDHDIDLRSESLIATGFLSLGPKVLAEVDSDKMRMDIVDEQIDTLGRALLGVTLGCARCHDHKFDPFSTRDYYGLAGIFGSTKTMDNHNKMAHWHENSLATPEQKQQANQHAAEVKKLEDEINRKEEQAQAAIRSNAAPDTELPADLTSLYSEETKDALKLIREQLDKLKASAPVIATAMGVTEGEIIDEAVRIRGDPLDQGDAVPRKFPDVLATGQPLAIHAQQSGRLELARWLVGTDHPLTARVMVNRLWRWHFGEGLVGTPDNFGSLGERPVNSELLDWLARQFMADSWSVKRMQRRIMLSSTYELSSRHLAESFEKDPQNRWQWRANVRRLEAEPLRDAILSVSGRLDTSMGGSLLHVNNREFIFNHTSQDGTKYDIPRRSVYLPVVRNHLYDVFSLFDYSDASVTNGNRPTSTVAPQALFMLNSQFLLDACAALAEGITSNTTDDRTQQIHQLYEHLLGRPPADEEIVRAEQFLQNFAETTTPAADSQESVEMESWAALCQILLASNEFVYLR